MLRRGRRAPREILPSLVRDRFSHHRSRARAWLRARRYPPADAHRDVLRQQLLQSERAARCSEIQTAQAHRPGSAGGAGPARDWLTKLGGSAVYKVIWEPLLRGKFGVHADDISAVWIWNKLKLRGGSRDGR